MNKKLICGLLLAGALTALMFVYFGPSFRSGVRIGYIENAGRHHWRAEYVKLYGSMSHTLRPEGDTLAVNIETESGEILLEISDTAGEILLSADAAGEYSVPAPGKVKVRIRADDHCGGFDVR